MVSSVPVDAPAAALLPRYEVVRELGRGGMGVVYEARDTFLDRHVAVKVVIGDPVQDKATQRRRRFHREARIVASLAHPNIIPIFDMSAPDAEIPFLVTELVDGLTLEAVLRARGRLPPEILAAALTGICAALGYAHAHGVVHRDLKPANVMVGRDGRPRLLDFGISKIYAALGTIEAPLTTDGQIAGTLQYMSPEQAMGRPVDQRSDLFSLGVLTYRLATGRLPFRGRGVGELVRELVTCSFEPPHGVPQALADVIGLGRRSDPEARPRAASEVAERLAPLLRAAPRAALRRFCFEAWGPEGGPAADLEETASDTLERTAATGPLASAGPVGREDDLAWILRAAAEVQGDRSGRVLVLAGDDGMGRSTLLRTLRSGLGAFRVGLGHHPTHATAPLSGLAAALDDLLGTTAFERADVARAIAQQLASEEDSLVGRLTDLLRPRAGTAEPPDVMLEELPRVMSRFLLRLADAGPVLIALDDVHRADDATLATLEHLSHALVVRPTPLLIVAASDPAAVARLPLAESVTGHRWLAPLGDDAARRLIRAVGGLEGAAAARVVALAAGNPFHLLQIARWLVESGHVASSDGRQDEQIALVPPTLSRLVGARFDEISRGCRSGEHVAPLLARCAVLGDSFQAAELEALLELERAPNGSSGAREALPAALDTVLDALVTARVLTEEASGDVIRFASGVFRVVALERAGSARRRRAIHRAVAAMLEARGAPPARLAEHYLAANVPERAAHHLLAAGHAALEAWALEEAYGAYEAALRTQPRHGEAALGLAAAAGALGRTDEARRALDVARSRADGQPAATFQARCHFRAAELERAAGDYARALTSARAGAAAAPDSALRQECWLLEAWCLERLGRRDEAQTVLATLEEGLRADVDGPRLGRCLALRATLALRQGGLEEAARLLTAAAPLLDDPREVVRGLHNRALVLSLAGDQVGALALSEQALAQATALGLAFEVQSCERLCGDVLVRQGDHQAALPRYDRAGRIAEAAGHRDALGHCHLNRAWALLYLGQLDAAAVAACSALEIGLAMAIAPLECDGHAILGEVWRRRGEPASAAQHLEQAVAVADRAGLRFESVGEALASLGRLRLSEGDRIAATRTLGRAAEILRESGRSEAASELERLVSELADR